MILPMKLSPSMRISLRDRKMGSCRRRNQAAGAGLLPSPWRRRPARDAAPGRAAGSPSGTPARRCRRRRRRRPSPSPGGGADRTSRRPGRSRTICALLERRDELLQRQLDAVLERIGAALLRQREVVCSSASFTASRSLAKRSMANLCARARSLVACLRTFSVSALARSHASLRSAASVSGLGQQRGQVRRGVGGRRVGNPVGGVRRRGVGRGRGGRKVVLGCHGGGG